MALKRKLQVFVSSTYTDLTTERQSAVEGILKAGHIPAGMELFAAGNESQMEIIRRWIDESDVYMLILGGRYGSIDSKTSLSYTELEYDYAVQQEIPFFAVVITEEALNKKVKDHGRTVLETEYPQELKLFREKVLSKISTFFNDPKDIRLAVHETLSDFLIRCDFVGWVQGNEIQDTTALIDEISRLNAKNFSLEEELEESRNNFAKAKKKSKDEWSDDDFSEIISLFKSIEISTKLFNKKEEEEFKRFPLLRFLVTYRDSLVTGVSNSYDSSDLDSLLFYNVLPKLEIHGLAVSEKVAGVVWRRKCLTPKGLKLLAYIDKKKLLKQRSGKDKKAPNSKPKRKRSSQRKKDIK